jgi:hypothetical protein
MSNTQKSTANDRMFECRRATEQTKKYNILTLSAEWINNISQYDKEVDDDDNDDDDDDEDNDNNRKEGCGYICFVLVIDVVLILQKMEKHFVIVALQLVGYAKRSRICFSLSDVLLVPQWRSYL